MNSAGHISILVLTAQRLYFLLHGCKNPEVVVLAPSQVAELAVYDYNENREDRRYSFHPGNPLPDLSTFMGMEVLLLADAPESQVKVMSKQEAESFLRKKVR